MDGPFTDHTAVMVLVLLALAVIRNPIVSPARTVKVWVESMQPLLFVVLVTWQVMRVVASAPPPVPCMMTNVTVGPVNPGSLADKVMAKLDTVPGATTVESQPPKVVVGVQIFNPIMFPYRGAAAVAGNTVPLLLFA